MFDCNPTIVIGQRADPISLGVVGTFNAREQQFDISAWVEKLGAGELVVALRRPNEILPYAVRNVSVDGNIATWVFDATDTAICGWGKVFLTYRGEGFEDATTDYEAYIASNSAPTGEVPSVLESWYQDMLDAKAAANAAAQAADASAALSESYAKGGTNTRTGENTDNAKYYKEQADAAAEAAQTASETAQGKAEDAQTAAEAAQTAAETAQGKAEDAQTAAEAAQTASETAQGKAEDAQTAAEAAQTAAETAQDKAEDAQTASESAQAAAETAEGDAEAWAIGKRGGVDVPSTDPAYHNNSKYWADIAGSIVPDLQLVIVDGALCQIITTT